MKEIQVVAGLYCWDGSTLVLKRSADTTLARGFPNLWELPGGKPEGGESPEAVLVREWWQELGVAVVGIGAQISTTLIVRPTMQVTIRLFEVRGFDGEPSVCESMHDEMAWFSHDRLAELTVAQAPGIYGMRDDILRYTETHSAIRRSP